MNWSEWGTDYLAILEVTFYFGLIGLWIITPLALIVWLVTSGCKQIERIAQDKHAKRDLDKQFNEIVSTLKSEDQPNGR